MFAVPDAPIVAVLVEFARRLRRAGMAVGSGEVLTYCSAMATLNPADLIDLYWAGRSTLVTRREQIPVYDRVFRAFFLGEPDGEADPVRPVVRAFATMASVLQIPATELGQEDREDHRAQLGLMASSVDILRDKAFAACTPEELAALRLIMATMRLAPPPVRWTAAASSTCSTAPSACSISPSSIRYPWCLICESARPTKCSLPSSATRTRSPVR